MKRDWQQYLTQVELEELKKISEEGKLSSQYTIHDHELAFKQAKNHSKEYGKQIKPYIELAHKRKENQESFEYIQAKRSLSYSRIFLDKVLGMAAGFVVVAVLFVIYNFLR